jgi:hypothetical protein
MWEEDIRGDRGQERGRERKRMEKIRKRGRERERKKLGELLRGRYTGRNYKSLFTIY